ncbi:MlaA family lipoprotein [Candidatus Schmidhempelia bombi]|jgi:phospholipid-binding lipoprotein MlaA|uniref:Phospholipid-binding lipoprotein MlaA n=1 Tax=Candidatus Schmidhempelia bombi str. Bimp TaxID=1387197 RepID=A0AB94IEX2_9GAMM|nr:MlaA family lipoprotein [Candidatus Schmidhempelia bombi]TEA28060.1 phospholipid-binding lipoprotein MlaA [Candidatus Schmidhempelia bombi str. Bimp]
MKKLIFCLLLSLTVLTGCASYNPETNTYTDPAEGFNRAMFNFNYHVLDPYIVRPTAVFWRDYVPKPIRQTLVNVSTNISEPASMVNYLLQGEGKKAAIHFTRFFLNTLFGIGGIFDVASLSDPQLQKTTNRSFGNVLGHYDVGYGPYVVLPFYGPATLREDGGDLIDHIYPPLSLLTTELNIARWLFDGLEARSQLLDVDNMLKNSDDPYTFMRAAYFQRKDFLATDGNIDTSREQQRSKAIDNYLDDIDDE